MFTHSFLKEMYTKFEQYKTPEHTPKLASDVIKLPQTAELASLFASMVPYFDPNVKPQDDLMQLKLRRTACLAPHRQAFCTDVVRLQRTVEDRHPRLHEPKLYV